MWILIVRSASGSKWSMYQPEPFLLSKLSATGNDFLIAGVHTTAAAHIWEKLIGKRDMTDVARRLCDRHEGIGADGILLLKNSADADFAWDFYNQDGSRAEMCGNAARCAGLWAARQKGKWQRFRFQTPSGMIEVYQDKDGFIDVTMPPLKILKTNMELDFNGEKICGHWIDSGVPHFVIEDKNLVVRDALRAQARKIRPHAKLGSAGSNVTYVQPISGNVIHAATFERGVENFTLACGTGAVAAAAAVFPQFIGTSSQRIEVRVPGGTLFVLLGFTPPHLVGAAHWIADFQLHTHAEGVFLK